MKRFYYLLAVLLAVVIYAVTAYALTAEEMLLLKRGGMSDEKILEIQKKEGVTPNTKIKPFDWNEDGKKDIIIGSRGYIVSKGHVLVYLNTGTNLQPMFDEPKIISDLVIKWWEYAFILDIINIDPYIVDWNNDGKKDFVLGQGSGEISVFINMGTNKHPIFAPAIRLNNGSLDVGFDSSPAMVDWNGDGKKDLVVGNRSGNVFVFLNIDEDSEPEFPSNGIKTDIKVTGNATPFIIDWNDDGKFDVLCGSKDGKIYIFINEGDSKTPKFNKAQTLQVNNNELKLPGPTSVIALDWDDDGKIDLLVSNKEVVEEGLTPDRNNIIPFGIYLLLNTGTREKPEFKELKEIKGKFMSDGLL